MKQERKEELARRVPYLPPELAEKMKGKSACNFAVMLNSYDDTLYVRCYHRYYRGEVVERQRYIFARDGALRLITKDDVHFTIAKTFREPLFCKPSYGYNFDNSYTVLNWQALNRSCMKYSCAESFEGSLLMQYLKLYCKHPNVEYLIKSGYSHLLSEAYSGFWGGTITLQVSKHINWKSNSLLKMLDITRTEFKLLRGQEECYEAYHHWKKEYPGYSPSELLEFSQTFGFETGTLTDFCERTGLTPNRIARYLNEQEVLKYDYRDYLDQCRLLRYDLHDTAVSMPRNFDAMHRRCSEIIQYKHSELQKKLFAEMLPERQKLEFSCGQLMIRQPQSIEEIIDEGAALNHCVGGYAGRHAEGKLHILFIRTADKPDVPYYTMELDLDGTIRQVRGYHNQATTPQVEEFVAAYKEHLASIYKKKTKVRKTA